ncbi:hypothetical protein KKB28_03635, partial [bacterium]|nr:hypothetical protein [bacterium]
MALAQERKERGYLGEVDLATLQEQIAKLVILEYQYPEFFRVISGKPEYLNFFTKAAREVRGGELQLEDDEILREFGNDICECAPDRRIAAIWIKYAGLRKFLSNTSLVEISDFDMLAKLKTTSQINKLGSLGLWLRSVINGGSDSDYSEMLIPDNLVGKEEFFVDTIVGYIREEISTVAGNAVRISEYVIKNKILSDKLHRHLFLEVASYVIAPLSRNKISRDNALIYLDNLHLLPQWRQHQLGQKLIEEVFQQEEFYGDCWIFLNHSNLSLFSSNTF